MFWSCFFKSKVVFIQAWIGRYRCDLTNCHMVRDCSQNHKTVACVERKLCVLPSSRVARLEVYRQEEGSDVMVLQNSEAIDWTAGDTLGGLNFRLYDEGDRLVSLPPKLTNKIKVWVVYDLSWLSFCMFSHSGSFILTCYFLLFLKYTVNFSCAVYYEYTLHAVLGPILRHV